MLGIPRLSSSLAFLVLTAPAFANPSTHDLRDLADQANDALGLTKSVVAVVDVTRIDSSQIVAAVQLPTGAVLLDLETHSVRAPGFKVLAQIEDGSYVEHAPGPVRTYRGEVVGQSGGDVSASWLDEGLFARVTVGSQVFWIQPLGALLDAALPAHHVVYDGDDVIEDPTATCAADLLARAETPSVNSNGPQFGGTLDVAELACDADFEYFQDYGTVTATQNRIESVIGVMNQQYESEVSITHMITTIIVRTSSNDPYSTNSSSGLLDQFQNHWNSQQGGVQRDVAHLFTGKNLSGSVIGIAYLSVVCNLSFAYGLVQSDFSSSFACVTDLSAHELGHNWGAGHCSCSNNTMNSFITCANDFSQQSINAINNYKNSVGCLDSGGGGASMHVASIDPGVFIGGGMRQKALITVVVVDNQGNPVPNVNVIVNITGDITETVSAVTNGQGSALMRSQKGVVGTIQYTACVANLVGTLTYNPSANVETCDNN